MSIKSWFSKLTERGGAKYAIAEQFLFGEGKKGGILNSDGSHINDLEYKLTNSMEAQKEVLDNFGIVAKKYTQICNDINKKRLKHSTVIDILTDKKGYITTKVNGIKGPKSLNIFLDNKLIYKILNSKELFSEYKSALKMKSWAKYIINITPNDAKSLGLASKPLRGLLYKQKKHVLANYLAICEGSLHDKKSTNFDKIMSKANDFTNSVVDFFNKNTKAGIKQMIDKEQTIVNIFINNISKDSSLFLPLLRLKAFEGLMEKILNSLESYFSQDCYKQIKNELKVYSLNNGISYYDNAKILYGSIESMEEIDEGDVVDADKKDSVKAAEAAKKIQSMFRGRKLRNDPEIKKLLSKLEKSKNNNELNENVENIKQEIKKNENINEKDKEKIKEGIDDINKEITSG